MFNKIIQNLKDRKQRILEGLFNCIPLPFERFRNHFPGWERATYSIITANQKVGKSKLVDFFFVYEMIMFAIKTNTEVKILYFSLEMSTQEKYLEFLSHLLFRLDGKRIDTTTLKSINKDKMLNDDIILLLESERYKKYIDKYEEMVAYYEDIKSPTGIYKTIWNYAENNGHFVYKTINNNDGTELKVIDKYEMNNPEGYVFIIVDNASNLQPEKGMNKRETIEAMSRKFITIKITLGYSPVLVAHQAQSQESLENQKFGKTKPSADGLGDAKTISRDCSLLIGLHSPFKFELKEYQGYNIETFRNNIRFMEILEDRSYGANGMICPLFFDGATSYFKELPHPKDYENLDKVYSILKQMREIIPSKTIMFLYKIKRKLNK